MTIREQLEKNEYLYQSKYSKKSAESIGRKKEEQPCEIRTCFQRDRDRITHCKSFRRLKHKTQVFLSPESDHYRTRLTHTLEVSQIARTIARALFLNEDLTEAIALGHDLGHTPFGHAGEKVLNQLYPDGFKHYEQSARVVEILEKNGNGLNLCTEVVDGILTHGVDGKSMTLEGDIVRFADKIAYINHDIDDAIRGHVLKNEDIPVYYRDVLGNTASQRIQTMIMGIVENSTGKNCIEMEDEIFKATYGLREFLFERVYGDSIAKKEEYKAKNIVAKLYEYYTERPQTLPEDYKALIDTMGKNRVVVDYIAGMSDNYAVKEFSSLFIPKAWNV